MRFKEYITEARLDSKDKRQLLKFIDTPKKDSFTLKSFAKNYPDDEREVDVNKTSKGGVQFHYNSDHDELTNVLVDIVDADNNLEFKVDMERPTNTTYFTIVKK